MKNIQIKKRILTNREIQILIKEVEKFSAPFYVKEKVWKSFKDCYILMISKKFAGVFIIDKFNNWIKLGPFVILRKFHGKGLGTKIFQYLLKDNKSKKLFLFALRIKNNFAENTLILS